MAPRSTGDAIEVAAGSDKGQAVGDDLNPSTFRLGAGTPVARGAALTATVAAAPAGGTGVAVGGWSSAADRDLAITTINNLKTRVDQLEARVQALGLIT